MGLSLQKFIYCGSQYCKSAHLIYNTLLYCQLTLLQIKTNEIIFGQRILISSKAFVRRMIEKTCTNVQKLLI